MASWMAWFLTPAGRRLTYGFTAVASLTAFSIELAPHTIFLPQYKEIVSMYQAAKPLPLSNDLMKRWNDTLKDLKMQSDYDKKCQPFTVFGFDVFHAGFISSHSEATVGLPINFTYKNVDSINSKDIFVNNEPVDWERKDAKQLLEALVLSEDAQRYAIAREVLMVTNPIPVTKGFLSAFLFASTGIFNFGLNRKYKLLERKFLVRVPVYICTSLFNFGMWAWEVDTYITALEQDIDAQLAELGDRYIKGATEFYEKMLKRNMALRSLLGARGERIYTTTGKERYLFRRPHVPIDERLQFFKDYPSEKAKKELPNENIMAPQKTYT